MKPRAVGVDSFTNAGKFDRKSGKLTRAKEAQLSADDGMDTEPALPAR